MYVCVCKITYYRAGRWQVPDKCSKVNLCLWSEDNFIKITTCTFALNVVMEKDREDQLDGSCEKWRSVTYSQWAEEYPTWNEKMEG